MEQIFSVVGIVWTDERNRLSINTVKKSEFEVKDAISGSKPLLKAVLSNIKYMNK